MRIIQFLFLAFACSVAMAGEQDLTVKQGAQLSVTLTGSEGTLTGRTLRMHVRSKVGVTTTKFVASTSTGELAIASASSATLTVGADVLAAVPVTLPVEYWVYDVESYTTAADVRREFWGRVTITRDVTRDTEATTETALAGVVRYDGPQSLTTAQKLEARTNIGAGTGGGGGAAAWGDITGTLSAQTDLQSALDLKAPTASPTLTGTPAAPTATSGTSTTQIATTAFVAGAVSTHSALTTGAHGITAAGAALLDDADAAAQRTTLGLGTAATQASGAFEASGAISAHNAVTTAHGISAYGATLVDDASASAARTTLGLGTAATTAATDYATAAQGTDDRTASGLRTASTVVSISSATAPSSGQVLTATSTTAATWQTPSGGGGSPAGSTGELQYNNAGALGAVAGSSVDLANGRVGFGTGSPAAVVHAVADSASEVALIAQSASSATAATIEARDSSGAVTFSTLPSGRFGAGASSASIGGFRNSSAASPGLDVVSTDGSQWGNLYTNGYFLADKFKTLGGPYIGGLSSDIYSGDGVGVGGFRGARMRFTSTSSFTPLTSLYGGTGAPSNSDGSDGDFYLRSDGGSGTTIYHKRSGSWVGVL